MKKITLSISKYSKLVVLTDLESIIYKFKNNPSAITKTIPIREISIEDYCDSNNYKNNAIFLLKDSKKQMFFDKENNYAYMTTEESDMRFPDLVYVLLAMFTNDLVRKSKYLLHSSSLEYDEDKSILLIGDGGAGKTSLAYKLIKDYGYKLISNDHTLLTVKDGLFTSLLGTKDVEMRYGVIKNSFKEIEDGLPSYDEKDLWKKKIIVNDFLTEENFATDKERHVTDVFQINLLGSNVGDNFVSTKNYVDQMLYLYEQLSKQIKGTYNLITGFGYPIPSFETEENLLALYNDIKIALENTEVHMAKGSLDELPKRLVKTLEK